MDSPSSEKQHDKPSHKSEGNRRKDKSSDDSGYHSMTENDVSIEMYMASKDPYRVSSNGAPLSRPWMSLVGKPDYRKAMDEFERAGGEAKLYQILERHDIEVRSILIRRRSKKYSDIGDARDSFYIGTTDKNPTKWKIAALEVKNYLTYIASFKNLDVEIANFKLSRPMTSSPLANDQILTETLESLQLKIIEELDLYDLRWTSLGFHNRSPKGESFENAKPTVLVYVQPGIVFNFQDLEGRITALLEPSKIPLNLEIRSGTITAGTDCRELALIGTLPIEAPKPENGSSIGISTDFKRAGTLGFFAWANLPGVKEPQKMMCTAFHVVVENDPKLLELTETRGVTLKQTDRVGMTIVESPAFCHRLSAPENLEMSMKANQETQTQEEIEDMRRLITSAEIGKTRIASGRRTNQAGRRMDWALVDAPNAFTVNQIPQGAAMSRMQLRPVDYPQSPESVLSKIGAVKEEGWVTKKGTVSNVTTGFVNCMDRIINWENGMRTKEMDVIGLTTSFAEPGDSGSAVVNKDGELVGILFGAELNASEENSGFVTPIQDLLNDLFEREGVTLSLPQDSKS